MTAVSYSLLVATIFALGAIAQVIRAVMGVPITVGQTSIPVWVSWFAGIVAAVLASIGFTAFPG